MTLHMNGAEFRDLLDEFQERVGSKAYTERIPYETWRKLTKLNSVQIDYDSPFVSIKTHHLDANGSERIVTVYSAKVYDNGFGRFFYDYVIKEREKMGHETVSNTISSSGIGMKADYMAYDCCTKVESSDATLAELVNKITDSTSLTWDGTNWGTSSPSIDYPYDLDSSKGWSNIGGTINIADISGVQDQLNRLEKEMAKKANIEDIKKNNEKENDSMIKGINFDFGPCGNTVRLSMYGMAIQNVAGEWVSYNPESREIINVDVFNMPDGGKYMYKMPVAIADVKVGDIVIHNRVPMFVTAINENGTFEVTDVRAGETKSIIPTRNMFGFNFMTKVVSMFSAFTDAPTADQPFGNMLPFLMMSDKDGKAADIDPVVMFMMMQGQNGCGNMFSNPMMMYFLMKDNKDIDPMMLMFMMNGQNAKPAEKPAVTQG